MESDTGVTVAEALLQYIQYVTHLKNALPDRRSVNEMDSKMHPALLAAAEEWIQQELQGVQSSASILYFLQFGRTLIFISDNR